MKSLILTNQKNAETIKMLQWSFFKLECRVCFEDVRSFKFNISYYLTYHLSLVSQVETLSYDHKPNNEEELRRIIAGGGWVQLNRVNGNLALSRALGDYVFKRNYRLSPQEQIVTGKFGCLSYLDSFMQTVPILIIHNIPSLSTAIVNISAAKHSAFRSER